MLRRLLDGMVWGAGLALGLLIIWSLWFHLVLPKQLGGSWSSSSVSEVSTIPPPKESETRFYGPLGSVAGGFHGQGTVLASGDGRIVGRITADGDGVEGVKIRLALNGSAYSQWSVTDSDGGYAVPVPYGEYRIDGFDLDNDTAQRALAGYIGTPSRPHTTSQFTVTADNPGDGLNLTFSRPVRKTGPVGAVRLDDEIVLRWHPYPGADHYQVRISESESRDDMSARGIFGWNQEPQVTETYLDLEPYKELLKVGRYYSFEVYALDERRRPLSSSPTSWREKDFYIQE